MDIFIINRLNFISRVNCAHVFKKVQPRKLYVGKDYLAVFANCFSVLFIVFNCFINRQTVKFTTLILEDQPELKVPTLGFYEENKLSL